MLSMNFFSNKLRSRAAGNTSTILFSEIFKAQDEVDHYDNVSQNETLDVPDSFTRTASRFHPGATHMRKSNRRVKMLKEQTSELHLLSAQENEGYLSDESTNELNSPTITERLTDSCKEDNDRNCIQELLNNQEIQKILRDRKKFQNSLENEASEFASNKIASDSLNVSTETEDALPMVEWTDMDEVDLKTVSFEPVPHIFEPQLSDHNITISRNDGNCRMREGIRGHGKVIKYPENVEVIMITKTHDPLGLTIRKEENSVIIGRVVYGGSAAKSGLFREGDQIVAVNGEDIRDKSIDFVNEMMRGLAGEIKFIVVPATNKIVKAPSNANSILHFKANFNYDPEIDMRPCQDLGISFQKGDILHVIDQRDPKWWQAYRDDEYDQPLAGIIPSMEFQICIEKALEKMEDEAKHKKKSLKSFRRNSYRQINEDYEPYIAVDVYWPRQGFKRPVVLAGVPNIGIQEICKKFIDFPERFSAAIPRTTRPKLHREVDGKDYHFVTRVQFEASIAAGKFVEYGKFDKHYYGTTFDAAWTIANMGKTCILNISLSSVKALTMSGLMPYVVLISPPSLERLKLRKKDGGEQVKEKDLVKIIDESRELEEKYDHYIDIVLINKDKEETFQQIIRQINVIERDPQWIPSSWLNCSVLSQMSLVSVC